MLDLLACIGLAFLIVFSVSLIMFIPVILLFNKLVWINELAEVQLPKAIIHSERAGWLDKSQTVKDCLKCGAKLYPDNEYDCFSCDKVYVRIDNMIWEMSERLANKAFIEYPRVKGPKGN